MLDLTFGKWSGWNEKYPFLTGINIVGLHACENNIDTVLRFVKQASSFHILYCFNELFNVTIYYLSSPI